MEQYLRSKGITVVNGKIPKAQVQAAILAISEYEQTDAGFKDLLAGIGMSLVALFSSLDASASAKDVDKYLGAVEEKIEKSFSKDPKLKDELGMTKNFKPIGKNGGSGDFVIKVGPYEIEGKYHEIGGASGKSMNFKSNISVDKDAPDDQKKSWEDVAKKVHHGIKVAFDS
jgi:hypothetical protein